MLVVKIVMMDGNFSVHQIESQDNIVVMDTHMGLETTNNWQYMYPLHNISYVSMMPSED